MRVREYNDVRAVAVLEFELYFVDIPSTIGMQSLGIEKLYLVAVDNLSDDIHHIMIEMFYYYLIYIFFVHSKQVMRKSLDEYVKLVAGTIHLNFSFLFIDRKMTFLSIMFHIVIEVNSLIEFIRR